MVMVQDDGGFEEHESEGLTQWRLKGLERRMDMAEVAIRELAKKSVMDEIRVMRWGFLLLVAALGVLGGVWMDKLTEVLF
jgi:hypothetical protein